MEAEVGGEGTVAVEGHTVGALDGFRFTPDAGAEGADGRAVRAAAQKALAGEFEKRSERFANAPNSDLALGSDGLVRWLGSPIAALTAGESALAPRVVLLADEQLTGSARDAVVQRAERFVAYQVTTVLKPLVDLQNAAELEGTARGIAYRLCENYGLVERREVSEEVRALDQEARAALRRYGVRFGAYHIFVPTLVKPAPAQLLTLLWAIHNDGREKPGYGEVTQLLSTGRTSTVADASFEPIFWRRAGYRRLGRRAVRVDILERLADLIRPAIAWKPGEGRRPEGGFEGQQFLITPAMMSILGATAEDMKDILNGLGYRGDTRVAGEVEGEIARYDADAEAAALAAAPAASGDGAAAAPGAEVVESAAAGPDAPASAPAVSEADAVATAALGADAPTLGGDGAPTAGEPAASVSPAEAQSAALVSGDPAPAPEESAAEARPGPGEGASADTETGATAAGEPAGETPAATAAPSKAPVDAGAATPGEAGEDTAAAAASTDTAGEEAEERTLIVWRPQRSGPRQQQNRRGRGKPPARGAAGDAQAKGRGKPQRGKARPEDEGRQGSKPKPQQGGKGPGGKPDRKVDPEDSPFGKLAALRDKLNN